jgi:hypothetical protein
MRGVLKPPAQGRDAYSQVIPLQDNNAYYINGQYPQQPQQSPAQQSQSNTWPADPETPYYPSAAAYGTPSTQYSNQNNGGYPSVEQSPSAPQTSQYHGYDARSNSYTYPEPAQATIPYVQQRPGASVDPESPEQSSTPKPDRMLYGQRYQNTVQDLEELMERLQVEIDASFVDGVHECCKTELTLGGNAFVPLMRPNIGPYADGGKQDLPAEFKKNFPSEVAKEKEPSQEDSQAETQTKSQDEPQPNTDAAPTTQEGNGASETQQPATSSASKQTPTRPTVTEPEDPLKHRRSRPPRHHPTRRFTWSRPAYREPRWVQIHVQQLLAIPSRRRRHALLLHLPRQLAEQRSLLPCPSPSNHHSAIPSSSVHAPKNERKLGLQRLVVYQILLKRKCNHCPVSPCGFTSHTPLSQKATTQTTGAES